LIRSSIFCLTLDQTHHLFLNRTRSDRFECVIELPHRPFAVHISTALDRTFSLLLYSSICIHKHTLNSITTTLNYYEFGCFVTHPIFRIDSNRNSSRHSINAMTRSRTRPNRTTIMADILFRPSSRLLLRLLVFQAGKLGFPFVVSQLQTTSSSLSLSLSNTHLIPSSLLITRLFLFNLSVLSAVQSFRIPSLINKEHSYYFCRLSWSILGKH
jgi:hypothetical protein